MFYVTAKAVVDRLTAEYDDLVKMMKNKNGDLVEEAMTKVDRRALHELEGELKGAKEVLGRIEDVENDLIQGHINHNGVKALRDVSPEMLVSIGTMSKIISSLRSKVLNQRKELRRLNRQASALRYRLIAEQKVEVQQKDRWIPIYETSPSGKQLFYCRVCGRISPSPDKVCATTIDPVESYGCSKYPNHPKQMTDAAKLAEIQAYATLKSTTNAEAALNEIKAILNTKENGLGAHYINNGTRMFAERLKTSLKGLSKAPQKRAKELEELVEFCDRVQRGISL